MRVSHRLLRFVLAIAIAVPFLLVSAPRATVHAQEPPPDPPPQHQLFLPSLTSQNPPPRQGNNPFAFRVDPASGTVAPVEDPSPSTGADSAPTARGSSRVLLADELSRSQFSYEFQTGNRLLIRAAYQNVTDDLLFVEPFFFTRSSSTDNIVRSVEPTVSPADLGGDGILSPGETTRPLTFEIIHKGQPFVYRVDANAGVERISSQSAPTGPTVITGEVYDDSTGLPLAGAAVRVTNLGRAVSPYITETTTDKRGRYRLVTAQTNVRLQIEKSGYTSAQREADVPPSARLEVFDTRLTPRSSKATTVPAVSGGTASDGTGYELTLQPFALANDSDLRLTPLSGQSLPGLLPRGWSPVAALEISPNGLSFAPPASLSAPAPAGLPESGTIYVARWDAAQNGWLHSGTATRANSDTQLQSPIDRSGVYVFLLADPAPHAPAIPGVGGVMRHELVAGIQSLPGDPDVALSPDERILLAEPGRKTEIEVEATSDQPMQSGTPYQVEFIERYEFTDGSTIYPEPNVQDFVFYAFPGGPFQLESDFFVTPSRAFSLSTLKLGSVEMRVHAPIALGVPKGELVNLDGKTLSGAGGEELSFPAAATIKTLPVLLSPLSEGDFPFAIPAGFDFLHGLQIDFHGAELQRPALLSLAAPGGVSADDQVLLVRLVEVNGASRLALMGKAELQNGRLVVAVDPQDPNALPFLGVRQEGRYALLRVAQPRVFVHGVVAGLDGLPLAGALVTADSALLVGQTDGNGRYVLAVPAGPVTVTVTDPATDDTIQLQGNAGAGGLELSASLSPTPPSVAAIAPADGATGVALSAAVVVSFTEAVDAASVTAQSVQLLTETGEPVPVSRSLGPARRRVTLRPTQLFASDTPYAVRVTTGVRDLNGRALAAEVSSRFRTADTTPPPPPPAGAVIARLPEGGFSLVTGSQGTIQPDWIVVIKNLTTGALTSVLPEADGSFSVRVPAQQHHRLELQIRDAAGNETKIAVGRFRGPDGAEVVGAEGGTVTGPGGVAVDVPAGALPPGTLLRTAALEESDFPAAPPANFSFVGGMEIDLGDTRASKSLAISLPAPADATADDLVIVSAFVTWPHGQGWQVIGQAVLENGRYTTAPSPTARGRGPGLGRLLPAGLRAIGQNLSSPIFGSRQVSFQRSTEDCTSFFVTNYQYRTGTATVANFGLGRAAIGGIVHVSATGGQVERVAIPATCNQLLDIEVRQYDTNELLRRFSVQAPSTRGAVTGGDFLTDDKTPPLVIQHNLYSGYQLDQLEFRFSSPLTETAPAYFRVFNGGGDRVLGTTDLLEGNRLLLFTPNVPFRLGEQYTVQLTGIENAKGVAYAGTREWRFKLFRPKAIFDLNGETDRSIGNQGVVNIREFVFTVQDPLLVDLNGVEGKQSLFVVDTDVLTKPVRVGHAPTQFSRIRALTAVPDVFAPSQVQDGDGPIFQPDLLFSRTLSATQATTISQALDDGTLPDGLRAVFDEFDSQPFPNGEEKRFGETVRLSRRAFVRILSPGSQWILENRGRQYLLKRTSATEIEVFTGRDLLVLAGSVLPVAQATQYLRIYDVTACTKPHLRKMTPGVNDPPPANCLDLVRMEFSQKILSDPLELLRDQVRNLPQGENIPLELGIPTQLASYHDPISGTLAVYVVNAGIGLQGVDVLNAANTHLPPLPNGLPANPAPDGLLRGGFLDVAVLKNFVLAVEDPRTQPNGSGGPRLVMLTPQLSRTVPDGIINVNLAAVPLERVFGVDAGPNFVYDMDGDSNLGGAEETDTKFVTQPDGSQREEDDGYKAVDELFDLAAVISGPDPDGEGTLWIIDLSSETNLAANRHAGGSPRILAAIPLPAAARSVQLDATLQAAFVEVDGRGVQVVDLRGLKEALGKPSDLIGTDPPVRVDGDNDGVDDRIRYTIPFSRIGNRAEIGIDDDPGRPLLFLSEYNDAVEIVQVCNNCQDLSVDFRRTGNFKDENRQAKSSGVETDGATTPPASGADKNAYLAEKATLIFLLQKVVDELVEKSGGTLAAHDIYVIEQGSGGCFWRETFKDDPLQVCRSFTPGKGGSDHDFEVFVPADQVKYAQSVIDRFVALPRPDGDEIKEKLATLEDFTLFAMPKEPFEQGLLLNSPPMNKEGDTAGDLGTGRQTLLLLWLMTTGGYVPVGRYNEDVVKELDKPGNEQLKVETVGPDLDMLVTCMGLNQVYSKTLVAQKEGHYGGCDASTPMFDPALYPTVFFTDTNTPRAELEARPPFTPTSGIPPLEGYEWARLQEYNVYKTGGMVRFRGGCDFNKNAQINAFFSTEADVDPSDDDYRDRAFDDAESQRGDCKSQLRTIAKSAIRTAFVQMVAHPQGNRLILDGRYREWTNGQPVEASKLEVSRGNVNGGLFCTTLLGPEQLSGPSGQVRAVPYTDAFAYQERDCDGFTDYIATMALESFRRGYDIFDEEDLPNIWLFWCVKVWKGCVMGDTPVLPIHTEAEANAFIDTALDFIEKGQRKTKIIYDLTVLRDNISMAALRDEAMDMPAYPFLQDICGVCSLGAQPFGPDSSRGQLRQCNIRLVDAKVNGEKRDGGDGQAYQQALARFRTSPLLSADKKTIGELKKTFGVKNMVAVPLQARVQNLSPNDLRDVVLALYEGDGKERGQFGPPLREHTLSFLPAGGKTIIDVEAVKVAGASGSTRNRSVACSFPGNVERGEVEAVTKPTKKVDIFPTIFALDAFTPTVTAQGDTHRAIAFVVDPGQDFAEADKSDNQTAFFYYRLARGAPPPPNTANQVPFVLAEFASDALCLANARLDVEVGMKGRGASGGEQRLAARAAGDALPPVDSIGEEELTVGPYEEVTYTYLIENRGQETIEDIRLLDDGLTVSDPFSLEPGAYEIRTRTFIPTEAGLYNRVVLATGEDSADNLIGPDRETTRLVVAEQIKPVKIRFFDATGLKDKTHPFSRYDVLHNSDTGALRPILGAVTDGAARVRVAIEGLEAGTPATVSIRDGQLADATLGIGQLILRVGNTDVMTGTDIDIPDPGALGNGTELYYQPPGAFVRPQVGFRTVDLAGTDDKPKLERPVKVQVIQPGTGQGEQTLRLRRPPVFVFHGLGGTPSVWDSFTPLVPPGGVDSDPSDFVEGHDGRFLIFTAGTKGTVLPIAEEARLNHARFRAALNSEEFDDFAIAEVDVVANSMGGLITRELARYFVQELNRPAPFHRLITIGTPHLGSPVADEVVRVRDEMEAIEITADPLTIALETLELLEGDPDNAGLVETIRGWIEVQRCAAALQGTGRIGQFGNRYISSAFASLDIYSGAVDDLRVYTGTTGIPADKLNTAIQSLQEAGVLVPTHHIISDLDNADLGVSLELSGLWTALAVACYWTPDQTTIERTKQIIELPGLLVDGYRAAVLSDREALRRLLQVEDFEELKNFSSFEQMLDHLDRLSHLETPKVILSDGNDRVVPYGSQRDDLNPTDRSVTQVIEATDHLDIKNTSQAAIWQSLISWLPGVDPAGDLHRAAAEYCNGYLLDAWAKPSGQPNSGLTNKYDVPCQVIFLLETDPAYKNDVAIAPLFRLPESGPTRRGQSSRTESAPPVSPAQPRSADAAAIDLSAIPRTPRDVSTRPRLEFAQPALGSVVTPGEAVTVTVSPPPTVTLASLALSTVGHSVDVPTATHQAAITVPLESIGGTTILAIGQDAAGERYFGYLDLFVDPGEPTGFFLSAPAKLYWAGQVEAVEAYARYGDGVLRNVSAPILGTTYQSTNPAVVAVHPSGLLQARGSGTAWITAKHIHPFTEKAYFASMQVDVLLADGDENRIPLANAGPVAQSRPRRRQPLDENRIPLANAGPDQTVLPEQRVTLHGGGSSDPDDDPLRYRWRQVSGPQVVLARADTATPQFVAPLLANPARLIFELTVRDDRGAQTLPDEVIVMVQPGDNSP